MTDIIEIRENGEIRVADLVVAEIEPGKIKPCQWFSENWVEEWGLRQVVCDFLDSEATLDDLREAINHGKHRD